MVAAIERVFDEDTLQRAARCRSDFAEQFLRVLTAHGPSPSNPEKAELLREMRAKRAAWEAYLEAADVCGLLDQAMIQDLRSFDADQVRGALGEARACWFLAGKQRLGVSPRPPGRGAKRLDMHVCSPVAEFRAEVKSPFLGSDREMIRCGPLLESKLDEANKQFARGVCNVLVLAPEFRDSLFNRRMRLVNAFIGKEVLVVPIALDDDVEPQEPYAGFQPDGRFARNDSSRVEGKRFTKVSAVLSIEEYFRRPRYAVEEGIEAQIEVRHHALVVHNPFAKVALAEGTFANLPQFVLRDGVMMWTDKAPVD
jgi:hypothetical protein